MSPKTHRNLTRLSLGVTFVLSIALTSLLVAGSRFSKEALLIVVAAFTMSVAVASVWAGIEKAMREMSAQSHSSFDESALVQALKDSDISVRRAIIEALGNAGTEEAVFALVEALKDSDVSVQEAAAKALSEVMVKDIENLETSGREKVYRVRARKGEESDLEHV